MQLLRQVKLSHRLALLVAIFSLGLIVYGGWSLRMLNELKVNGPVYQRIVQGKDLVADVLPPPEYILESCLVVFQLMASDDQGVQDRLVERLNLESRVRHAPSVLAYPGYRSLYRRSLAEAGACPGRNFL